MVGFEVGTLEGTADGKVDGGRLLGESGGEDEVDLRLGGEGGVKAGGEGGLEAGFGGDCGLLGAFSRMWALSPT